MKYICHIPFTETEHNELRSTLDHLTEHGKVRVAAQRLINKLQPQKNTVAQMLRLVKAVANRAKRLEPGLCG